MLTAIAGATALAAASAVLPSPSPGTARPADDYDTPISIAASEDGDIYVALRFGCSPISFLRRFGEDGIVVTEWELDSSDMLHVAEGAGGGVFVANGSADWLQHFSSNGPLRGEWSVRGLLDTVSVTNVFGTSRSEVYVITADASRRTVLRQDESGGHIVSWSVDDRAYDLTVNHHEGRIEGMVYVAHDNKAGSDDRSDGHVVRYFPTGKPDVRWDFATEVRGMDLKGDGTIWLGLLSSDTEPAHLLHLAPDRRVLRRCELEGEPVDLAVGPDDDVFVIRHWGSDPYDLNYEVLRISSECEEVDAWSQQQLSRQLWTITPQPSDRTPSASVGRSIHFPIALSD